MSLEVAGQVLSKRWERAGALLERERETERERQRQIDMETQSDKQCQSLTEEQGCLVALSADAYQLG